MNAKRWVVFTIAFTWAMKLWEASTKGPDAVENTLFSLTFLTAVIVVVWWFIARRKKP